MPSSFFPWKKFSRKICWKIRSFFRFDKLFWCMPGLISCEKWTRNFKVWNGPNLEGGSRIQRRTLVLILLLVKKESSSQSSLTRFFATWFLHTNDVHILFRDARASDVQNLRPVRADFADLWSKWVC